MLNLLAERTWAIDMRTAHRFQNILEGGKVALALKDNKPAVREMAARPNNLSPDGLANYGIRTNETEGGLVAVIGVNGVITRYGDACAWGTEQIKTQLEIANGNPNIEAIVLSIDSPGGSVNGTKQLALAIKNSEKPVVVWGTNLIASAALWFASQAKEFWIEDAILTEVGSVGVTEVLTDVTGKMEKDGVIVTILRSTQSPDKNSINPYEKATTEAISKEQSLIDSIYEEFKADVLSARPNVKPEALTGKVYQGKDALRLHLADAIGSLQDAVDRAAFLAVKAQRQANKANQQNKQAINMDQDTFPNLREVVGQDAILEGPTAEAIEAALVAAKVEAGQLTSNIDKLTANLTTAQVALDKANETIAALQPKATAWDEYQAELQGTHVQSTASNDDPQSEVERLKAKYPRLTKKL